MAWYDEINPYTGKYVWGGAEQFHNKPYLNPATPEGEIMTSLKKRLADLEKAGGFLKDIKAPHVTPYTPATTSLGRVTSLADFMSSGDTARLSSELRRGLTTARGKAYPEQAFTAGKLIEGYGRGRADIASGAYGKAQQMHLGEVQAENVGLQQKYQMDLQNAMAQYNLDLQRGLASEEQKQSLLDMMYKLQLMSVSQKKAVSSSPSYRMPSLSTSWTPPQKSLAEMVRELEGVIGGGNVSPSATPSYVPRYGPRSYGYDVDKWSDLEYDSEDSSKVYTDEDLKKYR